MFEAMSYRHPTSTTPIPPPPQLTHNNFFKSLYVQNTKWYLNIRKIGTKFIFRPLIWGYPLNLSKIRIAYTNACHCCTGLPIYTCNIPYKRLLNFRSHDVLQDAHTLKHDEIIKIYNKTHCLKVIYHTLYGMNNYVLIWGDRLSCDSLRGSHDSQSPHIRKHLCPIWWQLYFSQIYSYYIRVDISPSTWPMGTT